MTLKVRIKRPLFQTTRPKYGARRFSHAAAEGDRTFLETLTDNIDSQQLDALRNQQVQRQPDASRIPEEVTDPDPAPIRNVNSSTPISASHSFPAAKENSVPAKPPRPGALMRLFSWLQKRAVLRATKQLRVSETISLGEKRFVAILQVENRKFLIGGGASNVALLTQLDAQSESANTPAVSIPAPAPLPRLRGVY
jgi:hypothetical protein